jgi:cytochrome oxidase Cu insertion factor (SCO1/SenC/PrrC family)
MRVRGAVRFAALLLALALAAPLGAATPPQAGGFSLVDHEGRRVTDHDFRDRWLLVFFGYTQCPDACPTALGLVAEALDLLDSETRAKVQPVFISFDPERDTPAALKAYVDAFDAGIVGLTGTPEEVAAAAAGYKVHFKKRPGGSDGAYTMDHSSVIYAVDGAGRLVTRFSHMAPPERIADELARLVR